MNETYMNIYKAIWNMGKTISFVLVVFSCLSISACNSKVFEQEHNIPLNNIINKFSHQLNAMNVRIVGTGGSVKDKKHSKFIYMFDVRKEQPNIHEATKMIVEITELFLKLVNESDEIRPYLSSSPVTISQLFFTFSFNNSLGGFDDHPAISSARISDGILFLHTSQKNDLRFVEEYEEAYENAKAQVENSHRD